MEQYWKACITSSSKSILNMDDQPCRIPCFRDQCVCFHDRLRTRKLDFIKRLLFSTEQVQSADICQHEGNAHRVLNSACREKRLLLITCQALAEIRRVTAEETVSTDDDDLKRHGYSEWATYNIDRLPVAVAYPKSTEEVSKIAKVCHKYRIPMIPFSGGSVSTIVQTNRQLLILQVYRR